jgi:RNA 3'-terminal phosphate cyclase (ATP)
MIYVDGAQRSGSGTIVRYAVALAALLGEELRLTNIRARRDRPGLRPQHLKAIEAVKDICQGTLNGGNIGSSEITFRPGRRIGGDYEWDIGTAGSTTMLAMTVLPVACFAPKASGFRISGGLFQDFAPSAYHMQHVLFPVLAKMKVRATLEIIRPGYVPRGEGIIEVKVIPTGEMFQPLRLPEQGKLVKIEGVALCSHLRQRKVSQRMAQKCSETLRASGYDSQIELIYDDTALQAGAALALYAQTDTGCIIGADMAGQPRRSSEEIARYVARILLEDLSTGATVDRYLADQLILYAALAQGQSEYRIPRMTEHVETNLWLVESILGARVEVQEDLTVRIDGIGYNGRS